MRNEGEKTSKMCSFGFFLSSLFSVFCFILLNPLSRHHRLVPQCHHLSTCLTYYSSTNPLLSSHQNLQPFQICHEHTTCPPPHYRLKQCNKITKPSSYHPTLKACFLPQIWSQVERTHYFQIEKEATNSDN